MQFARFLLSVASAASFAPSSDSPSSSPPLQSPFYGALDYNNIKPKDVLIEELSKSEGIPAIMDYEEWMCRDFASKMGISKKSTSKWISYVGMLYVLNGEDYTRYQKRVLNEWMERVVNEKLPVSEPVARWAMLKCEDDEGKERFFEYAIKSNYVSLVKDLVDYQGSDILIEKHLQEYGLSNFPGFPTSWMEIVRQAGCDLDVVYPLLSDYPVNHPRIKSIWLTNEVSTDEMKAALTLHAQGLVKLEVAFDFQIDQPSVMMVFDEMFQRYPETVLGLIQQMRIADRKCFAIYQSGAPPSDDWWRKRVAKINNLDLRQLRVKAGDSFCSVIFPAFHFLHNLHPEWIRNRMSDLKDEPRMTYYLTYPQDFTDPSLLPRKISFDQLIPHQFSADLAPVYEAVVKKYRMSELMISAFKCAKANCEILDTSKVFIVVEFTIRCLQMCHPTKYYQKTLAGKSFNHVMTVVYYALHSDRTNDDGKSFSSWLGYLLCRLEPVAWADSLLTASRLASVTESI